MPALALPILALLLGCSCGATRVSRETGRGTRSATPAAAATDEVDEAVRALASQFYQPLDPAALYSEAWQGAATSLTRAGVPGPPQAPVFPHDLPSASALFRERFAALAASAEGRVSGEDLAAAAIAALAASRHDLHTSYQLAGQEALAGEGPLIGAGLFVAFRPPHTITAVLAGSTAAKAGLRRGETLTGIDGVALGALTLAAASPLVPVRAGQTLRLSVRSSGGAERRVDLPQTLTSLPAEEDSILAGQIGLLRLYDFPPGEALPNRVAAILADWQRQGVRAWILDLRANVGGNLYAVTEIASLLGVNGHLAGLADHGDPAPLWFDASRPALPFQPPLAVLAGPGSISGGEILAAILKLSGRATVVGEETAGGFGAVRPLLLPDGSILDITTAEVVIGSGQRRFNGSGLMPDVRVAGPTAAQDAAGQDPPLAAAVRLLEGEHGSYYQLAERTEPAPPGEVWGVPTVPSSKSSGRRA